MLRSLNLFAKILDLLRGYISFVSGVGVIAQEWQRGSMELSFSLRTKHIVHTCLVMRIVLYAFVFVAM